MSENARGMAPHSIERKGRFAPIGPQFMSKRTSPVLRLLYILALLAVSTSASARAIPNLVCHESGIVFVDPRSLSAHRQESQTVYRFGSGDLYIVSAGRPEYLYNKTIEVELGRYTAGHKVVQFEGDGSEFRTAIFVHSYRDEVRVSRATCKPG